MSLTALRKKPAPLPPGDPHDDVVLSSMDRRLERRLLTPGRVGTAVAATALFALAAWGWQRYGLERAVTVSADRVTVATVGYGTFREYIPVTGNIVPRTTVYLDAVEGGQITEVHVEEGALVEAGQPLVALKNSNLQLQVIAAEAQLTEQMNQLNQTRLTAEQARLRNRRELIDAGYEIDRLTRDLARRRQLVTGGAVSQAEVDELAAELDYRRSLHTALLEAEQIDDEFRATQLTRMQDALTTMNESLAIARENLDSLVITAPITGQLTLLEANVGESRAPGQRIGQIDEQHAFKVSAFVDEFYLGRVALGQLATFEAEGQSHELEVTKIYPDVRNRQFQIDLAFTGASPALLRRGQTVRMRLEIGQPADTLVLANGAFYDDTGGQWVFALEHSGNIAERRSVRFGRRNPDGIEVLEGLGEGDRVITSSYEHYRTFDRIQLRQP